MRKGEGMRGRRGASHQLKIEEEKEREVSSGEERGKRRGEEREQSKIGERRENHT